jgi:hypothetical protein
MHPTTLVLHYSAATHVASTATAAKRAPPSPALQQASEAQDGPFVGQYIVEGLQPGKAPQYVSTVVDPHDVAVHYFAVS